MCFEYISLNCYQAFFASLILNVVMCYLCVYLNAALWSVSYDIIYVFMFSVRISNGKFCMANYVNSLELLCFTFYGHLIYVKSNHKYLIQISVSLVCWKLLW